MGYPVLNKFFQLNFEAIIGLMCFPFVMSFKREATHPLKWAIASILFILLYLSTGIVTCNYFALGFLIFFVLEKTWGGINWPSIALLFSISPFFNYVIKVFSFPLRLQLTKASVYMLNIIKPELEAHGNIIQSGKKSFSVDPECMGLNLIVFSISLGLVILVHFEQKKEVVLTFWKTTLFICLILFLSVFGNLMRIVTITLFESLPETLSHEIIGITCLIIYTLLPFFILIKWYFKKKPKIEKEKPTQKTLSKTSTLVFGLICILNLSMYFIGPKGRHEKVDSLYESIHIDGFKKSVVSTNIIRFQNDSTLIYIKPPVGFFGADHDPKICWSGSGYAIKNQKESNIKGFIIQTAELVHQNGDSLYTAWWFDNGVEKTGLQFEWRKKSLLGSQPFRLINVTTESKKESEQQIKRLLNLNLFE